MCSVVSVDEEEGVSREEEAGPRRAERKALLLAVSGEQEAVGLPADKGPWGPRGARGTLGPRQPLFPLNTCRHNYYITRSVFTVQPLPAH